MKNNEIKNNSTYEKIVKELEEKKKEQELRVGEARAILEARRSDLKKAILSDNKDNMITEQKRAEAAQDLYVETRAALAEVDAKLESVINATILDIEQREDVRKSDRLTYYTVKEVAKLAGLATITAIGALAGTVMLYKKL